MSSSKLKGQNLGTYVFQSQFAIVQTCSLKRNVVILVPKTKVGGGTSSL